MSLPVNHPLTEVTLTAYISSIGGTPTVGYIRAPFRYKILKVGVVQSAAVTGTSTIATAINGTAVTGGSVSVTGGSAGSLFSATPTAANRGVEDDVISLTPSGATGSAAGYAFVVLKKES